MRFHYDGRMEGGALPEAIGGHLFYMVGIKGTGMAALAEILVARGARVTGSDIAEEFYTDALLRASGISWAEGFSAGNIGALDRAPSLVIHSAAYDPATHPEIVEARRLGLPVLTYTQALGELSRRTPSVGIAGVHGKTTTTALVACIAQELSLPVTVLAGSALPDVGGRATLVLGDRLFVAETCEYRRNFLDFSPAAIVVTSVEPDHLDYFSDAADIESAFVEYGRRLAPDGTMIVCVDDPGAARVAEAVRRERSDVTIVPYGRTASGDGTVANVRTTPGRLTFEIGGAPYELSIPGDHNALNAAAALLVCELLTGRLGGDVSRAALREGAARAFARFHGTRRRSEIIGEAGGVLVVDDYGHHPTAIASTLAGYRAFYPDRRLVVSFMSHTFSRTRALLEEFAQALSAADVLILHDIYASAREENPGDIDGEILAVAAHRHSEQVHYVPGVLDALPLVERILRPGDLFVTMGAGNNWRLGPAVLEHLAVGVAP